MQLKSGICLVALLVSTTLAGCGSGPLTVQEQFDQDQASAEAMAGRLAGLDNSAFAIFVDAGQVTYNGYAFVMVKTADDATALLGETRIVADFDTSVVTGSMTNFVGATGPVIQVETPAAVAYAGALTLSNGLVDGPNRPNQFGADFSGTLTGQGNVIAIDGAMIGDFRGGPLRNGIVGESTAGTTTATLNGDAADGSLVILAEADRDF